MMSSADMYKMIYQGYREADKNPNGIYTNPVTGQQIQYMLDLSADLKAKKKNGVSIKNYTDKNIALIFEKTSTRTRCSFEVAANDMKETKLENQLQVWKGCKKQPVRQQAWHIPKICRSCRGKTTSH